LVVEKFGTMQGICRGFKIELKSNSHVCSNLNVVRLDKEEDEVDIDDPHSVERLWNSVSQG
jgi:hypothetical protein